MPYIWQLSGWPNLGSDNAALLPLVSEVRLKQGALIGRMSGLGFRLRAQTQLDAMTEEVVKSSDIEGEFLARDGVRSSLARRLGVPEAGVAPSDRATEGVVTMMMDATQRYSEPLTRERLFGWHAALFPTGYSENRKIDVAAWRSDAIGAMQVVSGPYGAQRVHYEAPPANRVDTEMSMFLNWFNGSSLTEPLVRAALAHLWLVTIHPFEDGNGRIARAVADGALAAAEGSGQRFYSMSSQIRRERDSYYAMLERTQQGGLDVTPWVTWFLGCLSRAIDGARTVHDEVLNKAEFWRRIADQRLSERQEKVLRRVVEGFEGHITTKKWQALTGCSDVTAYRDVADLVERGILVKNPGGSRKSSYRLAQAPVLADEASPAGGPAPTQ